MLEYKNKKLKAIDEVIDSSDYILRLDTDLDVVILGVIIFANGVKKVIQFVNQSDQSTIKIARLITEEKELPLLDNVKFQVIALNGDFKESSNIIPIKYNKELIKTNIKVSVSNEYKELKELIASLSDKLSSLTSGKIISKVDLVNKSFIKPGMIPVAIDDKGNFAALYPFANNITCVNGQYAANGVVIIDSSMIEYKLGKSTEKAIDDHAEAISKIGDALKEISNELKAIRKHVDDVDIKLTQHINNGII